MAFSSVWSGDVACGRRKPQSAAREPRLVDELDALD